MLMLPIPAVTALCLACLLLHTVLSGRSRGLAVFLAACALQSLGIALAAGYGISALRPVLPISAATIPPLAWVICTAALFRPISLHRDWPHAAGPLACLLCKSFAPALLDVAVATVFAGYGAAILLTLRLPPGLPLARLGAGPWPVRLWRGIGAMLVAVALGDLLIAIAHAAGHAEWTGSIISLLAGLMVVAIGVLRPARGEPVGGKSSPPQAGVDAQTATLYQCIMADLDTLLRRERLHLDPGLTLQRLARRMRLPEKRLSAAVNGATGANLSRYINTWRIDHACTLIAAGESLTEAMLASGFNTKSNFNREFHRVRGASPGQWARQTVAKVPAGTTPAPRSIGHAPEPLTGDPGSSLRHP